MPEISIRFEKTTYDGKGFLKEFYESLELDFSKCFEDQKLDINPNANVKIFGMEVYLPEELLNLSRWVCRIEKKSGFELLSVGGLPWAAKIANNVNFEKTLDLISGEILALSYSPLDSLTDISAIQKFHKLQHLDFSLCLPLGDLSPLQSLKNLKTLSLGELTKTSNIMPLGLLDKLICLKISGCESLIDFSPLKNLFVLKKLYISNCNKVNDISFLRSLVRLERLEMLGCYSLQDINPLENLLNLKCLTLGGCQLLKEIKSLSSLSQLSELRLLDCKSLFNIYPLAALNKITSLSLRGCKSIKDLIPIKGLVSIQKLNLFQCNNIRTLDELSELRAVQSIQIPSLRIRSLEPLRKLPCLEKITEFNPPEVAELLAHTACLRVDHDFILKNGESWLHEAIAWQEGPQAMQDRFAATLGKAFSLLGESPIEHDYENFIHSRADFSSAPWKAWFGGTLKESGFDLYRQRVERVPVASMLPGAIGGACASLPHEENAEWARQWLAGLEKARISDAKALLIVAPEICLAHARLGETEALGRWLVQFTDPSDLAALDPIHAALAGFQLANQNLQAGENHIFAIQSPKLRDPVLAELVSALAESDPESASAKLLLIETPATRSDLAKRLVAKPGASEITLQRLAVATGDSPTDLADLIKAIPDPANKTFLETLSSKLQPERNATLLKISEELQKEVNRLLVKVNGKK